MKLKDILMPRPTSIRDRSLRYWLWPWGYIKQLEKLNRVVCNVSQELYVLGMKQDLENEELKRELKEWKEFGMIPWWQRKEKERKEILFRDFDKEETE